MIVAHSDSGTQLVRNPHFEEWSAAARPDGLPDWIVWQYGVGLEREVDEVLRGEADLMFNSPDTESSHRLRGDGAAGHVCC